MVWGRLKLKIPFNDKPEFTADNIEFVRKALSGCKASEEELKTSALLFILGQPFLNSCGNVYCIDGDFTKEYQQELDRSFNSETDPLFKELISIIEDE